MTTRPDDVKPAAAAAPPVATRLDVRGLRTNLLRWSPPAGVAPSGLTVLLLHGFADAAATFDLVAPGLAALGHELVAPDLRGFGDSDPVGVGGYYHFPDYVADVRALVRALAPARLALVGHSMGGTVAAMFTGTFPADVEKLVLLEGLGPPAHELSLAPDRFRAWLEGLDAVARRPGPRSLGSIEACVERLAATHPRVPREVLRTRAPLLVRQGDDGRFYWKFDPLHRTTSPMPFVVEAFSGFLDQIRCPTLFVGGGEVGYHPDDEAERLARIRTATRVDLDDAGHMMHWTRPELVVRVLAEFLAAPP